MLKPGILIAAIGAAMLSACGWQHTPLKIAELLPPMQRIQFVVDEGTGISVDMAPDQSYLIFDLLGDIYSLPAEGGRARLLRGAQSWDVKPRFSPDGRRIAFIGNDAEGLPSLWAADADGSSARRVSDGEIVFYDWDTNGDALIAWKRSDQFKLWRYPLSGEQPTPIYPRVRYFTGLAVGPAGRYLYVSNRTFGLKGIKGSIFQFDRTAGVAKDLRPEQDGSDGATFTRLRLSPDGKLLGYLKLRSGGAALYVLSLATGEHRRLVDNYESGDEKNVAWVHSPQPEYAFSSDGRSIYASLGGRMRRIDVTTGAIQAIPFELEVDKAVRAPVRPVIGVADGEMEIKHFGKPSVSATNASVVFSAIGKLWTSELVSVNVAPARRLTRMRHREYTPSYSPNGREVVYVGYTDACQADLFVTNDNGEVRNVTNEPGFYMNPVWAEDGDRIVFIRESAAYARKRYYPSHPANLEVWSIGSDGSDPRRITSYRRPLERNRHGFSPLTIVDGRVFFVEAGEDQTKRELVAVGLDGGDRKVLGHFPAQVDYAIPSPDGKRLAVLGPTEAWMIDMHAGDALQSVALPAAAKINGPNGDVFDHAQWIDETKLALFSLNRVFQMEVGSNKARLVNTVELKRPRSAPEGRLALVNATIVPMNGKAVIENGVIVIDGNRIVAVGAIDQTPVPDDAFTVDLTDKTIVPGLIDTHSHLYGDQPTLHREQKPEFVASLAYGVTTIYDAGAPTLDVFAQAEMVLTGEMLGPRSFSAGGFVHGRQYDANTSMVSIRSADDANRIVWSLVLRGATMIKSYSQPTRQQRRWLVEAARKHDVRITLHTDVSLTRNLEFIADGHTAIEHWIPNVQLYQDAKLFLAKSGVHVTPTRWPVWGIETGRYFYEVEGFTPDAKLRRFSRPEVTHSRVSRKAYSGDEPPFQIAKDLVDIIRLGGKVDIGAHGDLPGMGTHQEMWLLEKGGATPMEVLRAATLSGAEKIGVESHLGSIQPGKLADLMILNANPLENIRNTEDIEYVVKNGVLYHADSMTRLYPDYRPIDKPFWHADDDWEALKPELPESWEGIPRAFQ